MHEYSDSIPSEIGGYRLQRVLGEGGMATVFAALQKQPRRTVALKVIRPDAMGERTLARFQREIETLGRLRHPHIAQIFEAGTFTDEKGNERPYLVMEYVPRATTILDFAEQHSLSLEDRVRLFIALCAAVEHGHKRKIIHRDLKPANILVDEAGQVKVIDFGLARPRDIEWSSDCSQLEAGRITGTIHYMAPEQISNHPIDLDTRCDVYALGAILFELLTGERPHQIKNLPMHAAADVIRTEMPRTAGELNPALKGDLEAIISRALAKDRAHRYRDAGALGRDLVRYRNKRPVSARPSSIARHIVLFSQRHRTSAIAIGIALGIMLFAATLLVVSRLSTPVTPVAPTTTPPPSEASTPRRSNAPRGRANAHAAFEPLVPTSIMRLNGAATSLAFTNSGGVVGGSVEGDVQGVVLTNGPLPTPRFSMDDAIVDVVTCQHPEHGDLVFTLDESGRILTRHWPTGTVQDDIEDACTSAPSMSISLDGGMIAIACTDFQAQIMDIETLTDRRVRSSRGAIQTVSVTDSGDRLAGGTAGGQVYVWDTADGGLLSSIEASDVAISKVAWSSDGSMISALDASGECFVWDWDNSAGSATSLHQFRASSEDVVAASFDASGAWLVCVADGEVIVFDVQAGTESARRVVDAGGVESIAIDEDGRRVAYGTESGVVWFVVLPIQVEPVDLP